MSCDVVNPPTENLYFHYFSFVTHKELNLPILIETAQDFKDIYYHYLQQQKLIEDIDALITPNEENGIRIGPKIIKAPGIQVAYIKCNNYLYLLGMLKIIIQEKITKTSGKAPEFIREMKASDFWDLISQRLKKPCNICRAEL